MKLHRGYGAFLLGALLAPLLGLIADAQAQTTDRVAAIKARSGLDVCIWPAYYGISFRNPRDDVLRGIDIDLARAFAKDLGVAVRFVDSSFANFMSDLEEERCDVAMFAIGDTPQRRARVDLSDPHMRSGLYAITTKTNANVSNWSDIDKTGRVVAVQLGTIMEPMMRSYLKQAQLMLVEAPRTREDEVLSGRADVFITDFPYSVRMVALNNWARVLEAPKSAGETSYGYAVKQGQPAWLARVNQFVGDIKRDGRLEAAAKEHGMTPIILRK
ncbi:MAG: ABC transporter substrate-binding protein [Elsteraceae bacterium]